MVSTRSGDYGGAIENPDREAGPDMSQDGAGGSSLPVERKATVFETLSHPVLKSVDPRKVSAFLRERKRYELEVAERKKEVPSMTVASFRVSVDRMLLENMHSVGALDDVAPGKAFEDLGESDIEKYVKSIISHDKSEDVDPTVIEKAVSTVRMKMSIEDPTARMLEFTNDFFNRLDEVGYGSFKTANPKKTIQLMQERLHPKLLKSTMSRHLEYQEGVKKDLRAYVKLLCKEAKTCDRLWTEKGGNVSGSINGSGRSAPSSSQGKGGRNRKTDSHEKSPGSKSHGESKERPKKNEKQPPLCLHPIHKEQGIRHWLRDCGLTSKEEAIKFLEEARKKKSSRIAEAIDEVQEDPTDSSTRMEALFAGKQTRVLCADGGSDINLMPQELFTCLLSEGAEMRVSHFQQVRQFGLGTKDSVDKSDISVACDKMAVMTVELIVRHGKSLTLRNLPWYVTSQKMEEPLLGRPVLEALGLDTKKLLAAACDRLHGVFDMGGVIDEEPQVCTKIARVMFQGVFYSDGSIAGEDKIFDVDDFLDIGVDTEQQIKEALKKLLDEAIENGLTERQGRRLGQLLDRFWDIFRLRLGPDPPAKVEPMRVNIKAEARPVIAKARRYSKDQRDFLDKFVTRLVEYGLVKPNPNASWVAAPLLVAKSGPAKYRLTFDYRPINAVTIQQAWSMPHVESELMDLSNSKFFAKLDLCQGYWQMPLDPESQHLFSFITPRGIFQPTRTTQGVMNGGSNFSSRVEPCFQKIRDAYEIDPFKAWLDDIVTHARTEDELIDKLEMFFKVCEEKNLKLSAKKCLFFLREVTWCGRIVDEDGVRFDPSRLSGLQKTSLPRNAGELCEYVYCLQWMSTAIPNFIERIAPLRDILEAAYKKAGSRKKRAIRGISLSDLAWGPEHETAFLDLQTQIRQSVKLSHRKQGWDVCVFTDASELFWSGVITQCRKGDLDKDTENQRHEPLAFLGSVFSKTEQRWTTFEKEAFAIFQSFKKMDYLLLVEENTHVFTDHRNLLFVYNPEALEPALGRHVVTKVQRWALYLSRFSYTIEHIVGTRNTMADVMTRWLNGYRGRPMAAKRISHLIMDRDLVETPLGDKFIWPSDEMIRKSQEASRSRKPQAVTENLGRGLMTADGKIWIPENDSELQLKLLVIAHCGAGGHRGIDSTKSTVSELYFWKTISEDCKDFVKSCLHCLIAKSGLKIPRPISLTLHGTKPNEVLHFDFLFMGPGLSGLKYVLVLSDDLSSYLWLCPTEAADAEAAAHEIARWIRTFTAMLFWVSDQGSHFKNEVIKLLAAAHKIKHDFTVANSPWVNGTVESCMRKIRAACQALQSEMKLGPHDWPIVIGMIMTALNESPLPRLGKGDDGSYRSPLEVFTGLKPARSQMLYGRGMEPSSGEYSLERVRALQIMNIDSLQEAFINMHKDVGERVTENRKRQISQHNKRTNIVTPNFMVGDCVLVRRAHDRGHKMKFRWTGPRVIVAVIGEVVYDVMSLLDKKIERVHAARLLPYRSDMDGSEVSQELLEQAEHLEAKFELVEKLMDIGEAADGLFIQVQWAGLPDKCDWTWNALQQMHEDVPDKLTNFLRRTKKTKLASKAKAILNIDV